MSVDQRIGCLAGLRLRCQTSLEDCLSEFEAAVVHTCEGSSAELDYFLEYESPVGFRVRHDGEVVARTPHRANLVALLQADSARRIERYYSRALWLHAAAVWSAEHGALLLVGRSGAGKSTAALAFCRAGWQYLADDAVLLEPHSLNVRGLSWSIRLAFNGFVEPGLAGLGFSVTVGRWHGSSGTVRRYLRYRPPVASGWDPALARRLGGVLFLERGGGEVSSLSAGAALVRLWPRRIARQDGIEGIAPDALANALAGLPLGLLRSERPTDVVPGALRWLTGRGRRDR